MQGSISNLSSKSTAKLYSAKVCTGSSKRALRYMASASTFLSQWVSNMTAMLYSVFTCIGLTSKAALQEVKYVTHECSGDFIAEYFYHFDVPMIRVYDNPVTEKIEASNFMSAIVRSVLTCSASLQQHIYYALR